MNGKEWRESYRSLVSVVFNDDAFVESYFKRVFGTDVSASSLRNMNILKILLIGKMSGTMFPHLVEWWEENFPTGRQIEGDPLDNPYPPPPPEWGKGEQNKR